MGCPWPKGETPRGNRQWTCQRPATLLQVENTVTQHAAIPTPPPHPTNEIDQATLTHKGSGPTATPEHPVTQPGTNKHPHPRERHKRPAGSGDHVPQGPGLSHAHTHSQTTHSLSHAHTLTSHLRDVTDDIAPHQQQTETLCSPLVVTWFFFLSYSLRKHCYPDTVFPQNQIVFVQQ